MSDRYEGGARRVRYCTDIIRNGVKYGELLAVDPPTIEMVYNGEIKLSCTGTYRYNSSVNYMTDYIRPMMCEGGKWYPLGEYVIATPTEHWANGAHTVEIRGYDRTLYLQQATTTKRVTFRANNRYLDVIQAILLENGVQRIVVPEEVGDTLQTDREDWEIGTPYITIINQLLGEINFSSLWFDLEGNAQLTRYVPPTRAPVNHVYQADRASVLCSNRSKTTDLYEAYNVFVKVVTSPDYPFPLVARAVNDDPNSPISTVRRGREVVDPETQIDNIASQAALQEYVNNLRDRSKLSTETIRFETANIATHRVRDIISLKCAGFEGLLAETRWTMTLSHEGRMTHEGRVIAL